MKIKHDKIQQLDIKKVFTEKPEDFNISYILLDKRLLHVGKRLSFDLFYYANPTQMTLYLQSNTIINRIHKKQLIDIEQIYVSDTQRDEYERFVEEHLQNILQDESLTLDEKTDIIYTSSTELISSLYENPNALENSKKSEKIVVPILESILYNEDTIASYIKIIEYDYYTHTHSLNVSIYALCLGAELALNKEDIEALGRAALLHDLGKSKIGRAIVNKHGILTPNEFERMKMHPAYGYDIAIHIGIHNKKILDGIRHHHEKLNGMGYPDKLSNEEITLFPRVIGICDVFDALTTRRSYKDAMKSFDALNLMKTKMNTHLDIKLLKIFIKMLHA